MNRAPHSSIRRRLSISAPPRRRTWMEPERRNRARFAGTNDAKILRLPKDAVCLSADRRTWRDEALWTLSPSTGSTLMTSAPRSANIYGSEHLRRLVGDADAGQGEFPAHASSDEEAKPVSGSLWLHRLGAGLRGTAVADHSRAQLGRACRRKAGTAAPSGSTIFSRDLATIDR